MNTADTVVVGGGIVGLATALALLEQDPGQRLTVLEAEEGIAAHQTGHNSGVIHAGVYYQPGSLKARLCAEGRTALEAFCEQEGVPFARCGKLILATRADQLPALEQLAERARANGLTGVLRLDGAGIREREPEARGLAGLLVPQTGIVDYRAVAAAMAGRLRAALGEMRAMLPGLAAEDLAPGGAGVRAQAVDRAGRLLDDFHIVRAPGMVHVLNAPSPAATASLAIGRVVAGMVAGEG